MKYILIIAFFILTAFTFGQVPPNDTIVIKDIFWRTTYNEPIVYTDKVENGVWDKLKKDLEKKNIIGSTSSNQNDSLKLTDKEQEYLIAQIEKNKAFIWPDGLFKNSKRIELDSMWSFLKKERARYSELRNKAAKSKDTLMINQLKNKLPWVYTFTKPIYLRDNTICVLYFRKLCGQVEGSQDACICKKKNGKWEGWIFLSGGDW
jgi:hypothetical protein